MVVIVDSKLLAYNELHAHKPVINLFATLVQILDRVEYLTNDSVTKIIFTYDIGKSEYRLNLWDKYKGKRNYGTIPDDFKLAYENGVPAIARELGISNFPIVGLEADDIAGILCNKITDNIILITGDHDWLQLVLRHDNVRYFNTKNWNLLEKEDVYSLTGCKTETQFLVKKCILGDSGDNIIGVPGIGEVKFGVWKEDAFKLPDDKLKDAFLDLCEAKNVHKTHRDYMYNGVHTCEELYDFNMKLGRVMSGVKFLSDEQKGQLNSYWVTHTTNRQPNIDKASALSEEFAYGYTTPFGDPWFLDVTELEKYNETQTNKKY